MLESSEQARVRVENNGCGAGSPFTGGSHSSNNAMMAEMADDVTVRM